MSDRDQQDELPCEGCPDPGMPCLGCPAVDQQDESNIWTPEQAAALERMQAPPERDQQDEQVNSHWNWDVDDAAPSMKLREALDNARAEGERAATERAIEIVRRDANRHTMNPDQLDRIIAAIKGGEHE